MPALRQVIETGCIALDVLVRSDVLPRLRAPQPLRRDLALDLALIGLGLGSDR